MVLCFNATAKILQVSIYVWVYDDACSAPCNGVTETVAMMTETTFVAVTSLPCGVVHRVGRTADRVVDRVLVREIFNVLVDRATASVHEKVDDCRHFEPKLLGNCSLDLFAWALDLFEDCHQSAPLDFSEDHPRLLCGCWRRRWSTSTAIWSTGEAVPGTFTG